MTDKEQSFEEWLAEERSRLDKGFFLKRNPVLQQANPVLPIKFWPG